MRAETVDPRLKTVVRATTFTPAYVHPLPEGNGKTFADPMIHYSSERRRSPLCMRLKCKSGFARLQNDLARHADARAVGNHESGKA